MYQLNYEENEVLINGISYKLSKEGDGGNASVFKVNRYEPQAVIKILKQSHTENDLLRFRREVKILNELSARELNVPIVYLESFDEVNKSFSYIMTYNESIKSYIKKLGSFTFFKRIELLENLAELIHELHKLEIYHRDIKASNILYDNEKGFILCDFGIAFPAMEETITTMERPGNKILPDKFRQDTDFNSRPNKYIYDVYLLGVFVWEVMTINSWIKNGNGDRYDELDIHYNTNFYYSKGRKVMFSIFHMNELLTNSITSDENNIIKIEEFLACLGKLNLDIDEDIYLLDDTYAYILIELTKFPYTLYVNDEEIDATQYSFFKENNLYAIKKTSEHPWETIKNQEENYSIYLFKIINCDDYVEIEFYLSYTETRKKGKKMKICMKKDDKVNFIIDGLKREIKMLRV